MREKLLFKVETRIKKKTIYTLLLWVFVSIKFILFLECFLPWLDLDFRHSAFPSYPYTSLTKQLINDQSRSFPSDALWGLKARLNRSVILTVPPFIFLPCTNKPASAMGSQLQVLCTRLFVFKEKGERVGIFPVYDCCHSYKAFIHLSKFCIFLLVLVSFLVAMIWKKKKRKEMKITLTKAT